MSLITSLFSPAFEGPGGGGNIIAGITSTVAVGTTAMKGVKIIREGQMGVRTSFGRARRPMDHRNPAKAGKPYGIVGPGWHVVFPFTHSITVIDVKDRTHPIPVLYPETEEKNTDEKRQFEYAASLTWAVDPTGDNPLKSFFNLESPGQLITTVTDRTADGLRGILEAKGSDYLKNKEAVQEELFDTTGQVLLSEYGVAMKSLNLIVSTRSKIDRLSESIAKAGRMAIPSGILLAPEADHPMDGPTEHELQAILNPDQGYY